ncbi:hypothetical protein KI387_016832, partial [Taxus chinensis]
MFVDKSTRTGPNTGNNESRQPESFMGHLGRKYDEPAGSAKTGNFFSTWAKWDNRDGAGLSVSRRSRKLNGNATRCLPADLSEQRSPFRADSEVMSQT